MSTLELSPKDVMKQSIEQVIECLESTKVITADNLTRGYIDMAIVRQQKILKKL